VYSGRIDCLFAEGCDRERERERERERDFGVDSTLASVAGASRAIRDPQERTAREMEESIYKNNRYTLIKVRIANVIYHSPLFLSSSLPRGSAGGCRHRAGRKGISICGVPWQYVTTAEDIRSRKSISLILPRQRQKYETILSPYIIRLFFDAQPSNRPSYFRRVS